MLAVSKAIIAGVPGKEDAVGIVLVNTKDDKGYAGGSDAEIS